MAFDAFLEAAWSDHGDRPQEVADRLASCGGSLGANHRNGLCHLSTLASIKPCRIGTFADASRITWRIIGVGSLARET